MLTCFFYRYIVQYIPFFVLVFFFYQIVKAENSSTVALSLTNLEYNKLINIFFSNFLVKDIEI